MGANSARLSSLASFTSAWRRLQRELPADALERCAGCCSTFSDSKRASATGEGSWVGAGFIAQLHENDARRIGQQCRPRRKFLLAVAHSVVVGS